MVRLDHLGRDAVAWVALALVVCSILVATRRPSPPRSVPRPSATTILQHPTRAASTTSTIPAASTITPTTARHASPVPTTVAQPAARAPARAATTTTEQGRLSPHGAVAATYPVSVAPGTVAVNVTWPSGPRLAIALACPGISLGQTASLGFVALRGRTVGGTCRIVVSLLARDAVSYRVTLQYPSAP